MLKENRLTVKSTLMETDAGGKDDPSSEVRRPFHMIMRTGGKKKGSKKEKR